jgi:MarR family transcriptional regulator, organic hydroperoxide resistance regulator
VKRLEQKGLVRRHRRETDERQVAVKLTAPGRTLLSRSKCLNKALLKGSGMTRKQIKALNDQIKHLRKALNSGLMPQR